MPEERSLKVGRLVVHGRDIQFRPAKTLDFEVGADERAVLELDYEFEEASLAKEHVTIRMKTLVGEGGGGLQEARVDDTPGTKTRLTGSLRQELGLPHHGSAEGSVEIDATYDKRAWLGLKRRLDQVFNTQERFSVFVKPARQARKDDVGANKR